MLSGTASWVRISSASTPPRTKKTSTVARYMIPIRLWSVVVIHDVQPRASRIADEAMICGRGRVRSGGVSVVAAKSSSGY